MKKFVSVLLCLVFFGLFSVPVEPSDSDFCWEVFEQCMGRVDFSISWEGLMNLLKGAGICLHGYSFCLATLRK